MEKAASEEVTTAQVSKWGQVDSTSLENILLC